MAGRASPKRIVQIHRPISSFVGRETEVATLAQLLQSYDARLITLTGPGGVGKTRLALEAVADQGALADIPVDVVSLAPVRDHTLVIGTISRALGIREQRGLGEVESLAHGLGASPRLVLLDNLEQVVDVGPRLGELLARCPHLRILCTSRVRLNIQGEYQLPVLPLAFPANDVRLQRDTARATPALALFIQRARQTQPDFDLTDLNLGDVLDICRRLDGLPLAIELAAAQLSLLSLGALRSGLDQRLELLRAETRDQPPRLRSLADAIDWSYALLEPEEQQMLRALSVFLGGWTVPAAADVGAVPVSQAFRHIAALNEKSLVRAMPWIDERAPRFTMLETIRAFGLNELDEEGELRPVRAAHAAYFLALAEELSPKLDLADQGRWLDVLEREHDNIRHALDWFLGEGDGNRGVRLASAMFRFWDTRDYLSEGRRRLEAMLALHAADTNHPSVARANEALAELSLWQADYAAARAAYTRALELFRSLGDRPGEVRGLKGLAVTAISVRELDHAEQWIRVAAQVALEIEDTSAWADIDFMTGLQHMAHGRYGEAEACMRRLLNIRERLGDRSEVLSAVCHLAEIATQRGETEAALDRWGEALELTNEVGEVWCYAWYLEGIAHLLLLADHAERACRLLGAAEAWRTAQGAPPMQLGGTESTPIHLARARLGEERYAVLREEGSHLSLEEAVAFAQEFVDDLRHLAPGNTSMPAKWEALGLTAREGEIVELLCYRLTNKEIGERLFISPRTASTHVTSILGKLGLDSRREIPTFAAKYGAEDHRPGTSY